MMKFYLFIIAYFIVLTSAAINQCGSGEWVIFENSCLLFKEKHYLTYYESENFCKSQNATLVKIDTDIKYHFIQKLLNNTIYTWVSILLLKHN